MGEILYKPPINHLLSSNLSSVYTSIYIVSRKEVLDSEKMTGKYVALVIGASRGIGRQIAIDLSKNGYAGKHESSPSIIHIYIQCTSTKCYIVVVAAKTTSDAYNKDIHFPPDPNSPHSTVNTVEREIRESGGDATALQVDTRDHEAVTHLVNETVRLYGKLDVLVYNSGAIWWSSVEKTPMKRFMLMQQVNPEGLYASVQAALPHFQKNGWKGRIIVVSPPIYSRFFKGKTAYAMGRLFSFLVEHINSI